jgi:hypothetical protein
LDECAGLFVATEMQRKHVGLWRDLDSKVKEWAALSLKANDIEERIDIRIRVIEGKDNA